METKMIGVYLILSSSHIFQCVLAASTMSLTVEEFNAFQGIDPTSSCGNPEGMKTQCNKFAENCSINTAAGFEKGYPGCVNDTGVPLTQAGGTKTVKKTTIMNCRWKGSGNYVIGKGQARNHVMNYLCDTATGICKPAVDISYDTESDGKKGDGKKGDGKNGDGGKKGDGKKDDGGKKDD